MSQAHSARCAVILGPYASGKTSLLEAMLQAAGALARKGKVSEGNSFGDFLPEARARQMTTEPNFARCSYLGEDWSLIDCPGSVELQGDTRNALMAADVAIIVVEPDAHKAVTLGPMLKFLDDYGIAHLLFINKMDRANARVRDILSDFQAVSTRPLLLRQVPLRQGEEITGFVDLASERAWAYRPNKASKLIEMPEEIKERESQARRELLESLADFDDHLLEQLLEDKEPPSNEIYSQLSKDLQGDLIVPVFLGSAEGDNGIQRLWKALRHETPSVEKSAERFGLEQGGLQASIIKTIHQPHSGKLSVARIWSGEVKEGDDIGGLRLSGLVTINGAQQEKCKSACAGDLVAFARMEDFGTGQLVTDKGAAKSSQMIWPDALTPVYARALRPEKREDEVKLTTALDKLLEEDPSLKRSHRADTHELVLEGQGDIHLQIAADRLRNRFNVNVVGEAATPAYKETIRRPADQHARHKRQSGGHGQFADIKVKIHPLGRGEGFQFNDQIVGGSIPRQYIPAVETGVKDYLSCGPLGFPVVDVGVTLYDGQFHSVDSSDMAFKTAGRLAMSDGLPTCEPVLLEPIFEVLIHVPSEFTNKVHGLVSGRRGHILGFDARPGWDGWDQVKAHMPQAEIQDLIVELRSLTQGLGTFEADFDHLQELQGRLADKVVLERKERLSPTK